MKLPIGERRLAPVTGIDSPRLGLRTNSEGQPIKNRILLALPEDEFNSLRASLMFQNFSQHTTLYEAGATLEFAYFLNCGLVSVLVVTQQGKTVEVGVVGNGGMLGTPALAGLSRSPHRAVVQIAGDGFRVRLNAVQHALSMSPYLQRTSCLYAIVQGMEAAQSVACNRLHGVEQRLARWLLIAQDRAAQDSLHITHEFLATMLGTDRPSVSLAAGILQRKGAIEYTRGQLRIANHEKLQEASCECYAAIREFDALLGDR
jgi:CRP-like cAMP-binding protein